MKEMQWFPHHEMTDGQTDRVDGYLANEVQQTQLDVSSLHDECVSDHERQAAAEAWARGEVYLATDLESHGVQSLIVPEPFLTANLVAEALRRFNP